MTPAIPSPTVGILGGMGPAATVDLYAKLIAATPVDGDQDHLPVVIWADPRVPDRTAALLGDGPDPVPALRAGIQGLKAAGVTLLAVACNTAHAFVPDLAREAGLELVSMIEVTARHLRRRLGAGAVVGLLATEGTIISGLYETACDELGVTVLNPDPAGQRTVNEVIAAVKAGETTESGPRLRDDLIEVIVGLRAAGAGTIVAGCTEIVLGLGPAYEDHVPAAVVDPAMLLAHEVVRRARADEPPRDER